MCQGVAWSRLEAGVLLPQEVRCFLKLEDEWESQVKEECGDSYKAAPLGVEKECVGGII